jgi:hypothetical protein
MIFCGPKPLNVNQSSSRILRPVQHCRYSLLPFCWSASCFKLPQHDPNTSAENCFVLELGFFKRIGGFERYWIKCRLNFSTRRGVNHGLERMRGSSEGKSCPLGCIHVDVFNSRLLRPVRTLSPMPSAGSISSCLCWKTAYHSRQPLLAL